MARKRRKAPPERAYARLTRRERDSIERGLERGDSCRKIAGGIGRSPSTVAGEVAGHRFYTSPRSRSGERVLPGEDVGASCPRLGAWPRCCNGCRRRRAYGCNRRPRVFYQARRAQAVAESERSSSRRGIDETEGSAARKIAAVRELLARGLSPAQIAATRPDLGLSRSTIYRWAADGYGGMTAMELRRKVGYRPRRKPAAARPTRHSPRRSHAAFLALGDACAAAWEMDTVEGSAADSARLLTLLHRPSRFQLALPVPDGACASVLAALGRVSGALGGPEGMRRVFGAVLTDNGAEFADEGAIAALLGEREGETRLFYCDPRQSQQKGACEKNHVEIRKMLPKGSGIRFDRLGAADAALVMSHVNSGPRASLGWRTPAGMLRAMLGADAGALMAAFGVEEVPAAELDLTYGSVARAREERGAAPLA